MTDPKPPVTRKAENQAGSRLVTDFAFLEPTPDEIIAARQAANLRKAAASRLLRLGAPPRWSEYENGKRSPDPVRWAMFLLLTGQHPDYQLTRKRG